MQRKRRDPLAAFSRIRGQYDLEAIGDGSRDEIERRYGPWDSLTRDQRTLGLATTMGEVAAAFLPNAATAWHALVRARTALTRPVFAGHGLFEDVATMVSTQSGQVFQVLRAFRHVLEHRVPLDSYEQHVLDLPAGRPPRDFPWRVSAIYRTVMLRHLAENGWSRPRRVNALKAIPGPALSKQWFEKEVREEAIAANRQLAEWRRLADTDDVVWHRDGKEDLSAALALVGEPPPMPCGPRKRRHLRSSPRK